jgi:hypothetical protein
VDPATEGIVADPCVRVALAVGQVYKAAQKTG